MKNTGHMTMTSWQMQYVRMVFILHPHILRRSYCYTDKALGTLSNYVRTVTVRDFGCSQGLLSTKLIKNLCIPEVKAHEIID